MRGLNALQSRSHMHSSIKNDDERNKYIRSANMLKKELRGRKLNITRSMDAEERFHQKRMEYVKYCIHVKHNIPLDLISMNWTLKHVSVKGQIVVKNMTKWKPQVRQIPRHRSKSRGSNGKMALKKTHRNDCEQSRDGTKNEEMKERLRVVKCTKRQRHK